MWEWNGVRELELGGAAMQLAEEMGGGPRVRR